MKKFMDKVIFPIGTGEQLKATHFTFYYHPVGTVNYIPKGVVALLSTYFHDGFLH